VQIVGAYTGVHANPGGVDLVQRAALPADNSEQASERGGADSYDAAGVVPDSNAHEHSHQSVDASTRYQIGDDIRHELGTIIQLAALMTSSKDIGPDSRLHALQILGEARWLDELLRAYDDGVGLATSTPTDAVPIRLDLVAGDVVRPIQLSSPTRITLEASGPVWAIVDRLSFWRAVRNTVCNAIAAAGPDGVVAVHVFYADGYANVDIDDDGPGFGATQPSANSLGLRIVDDFVRSLSGQLEIRRGSLGGCRIRLLLPASPEYKPADA
jgi:signal transduction histidine kinase